MPKHTAGPVAKPYSFCDLIRVLLHDTVSGAAAGPTLLDPRRVRRAVRRALSLGGISEGLVNVAIVDDPTIHDLNRRHLAHDYPTDVLSFLIEASEGRVEGDIVASADTATREAAAYGWTASDELLLYVVHGALHLAGFDDLAPEKKDAMRKAEREVLAEFGLKPRYEDQESSS